MAPGETRPTGPAIENASITWSVIHDPRVGWMDSSHKKKPTFGGVGRTISSKSELIKILFF
jgi:hypothetical protein